MTDSEPIRVVLADDHPVVRAGIKTMLEKEHAEAEALQEDRRHDLARRIQQLDA